ncbi:hypothetical protein [Thiolapillus sp.]
MAGTLIAAYTTPSNSTRKNTGKNSNLRRQTTWKTATGLNSSPVVGEAGSRWGNDEFMVETPGNE